MSERFKAIRILFKSVVGTANVIVILLFIASAFSDRISPDRSVFFSYLGLGFPVFCVLNLCFVVYWLFLWEWRVLFFIPVSSGKLSGIAITLFVSNCP